MTKLYGAMSYLCGSSAIALLAVAVMAGGGPARAETDVIVPIEFERTCSVGTDGYCKDHNSKSLCEASPRDCEGAVTECRCTWVTENSVEKCVCQKP